MFSMSRNILAMSEFTSGGAILDFKMATICVYTTLYLTSYYNLEGKYRILKTFLILCGNCHHVAVILEFKMAATLLSMQFSMIGRCR